MVIGAVRLGLLGALMTSCPAPVLVKVLKLPPEAKAAPIVVVMPPLPAKLFSTLMVGLAVPKVMMPFKVRFWAETPEMSWVLAVMLLAITRAAPPARILAPSVMTRLPKPTGLAVMTAPTVLGVLSAPKIREPPCRLTDVEPIAPKVLAPARTTLPVPARFRTFVAPAPEITALTMRLFGERPPVVMVRVALFRVMVPAIVGVKLKLSLFATMLPPRVRSPPVVTVGVALPPVLLKVRVPPKVLAPV